MSVDSRSISSEFTGKYDPRNHILYDSGFVPVSTTFHIQLCRFAMCLWLHSILCPLFYRSFSWTRQTTRNQLRIILCLQELTPSSRSNMIQFLLPFVVPFVQLLNCRVKSQSIQHITPQTLFRFFLGRSFALLPPDRTSSSLITLAINSPCLPIAFFLHCPKSCPSWTLLVFANSHVKNKTIPAIFLTRLTPPLPPDTHAIAQSAFVSKALRLHLPNPAITIRQTKNHLPSHHQ